MAALPYPSSPKITVVRDSARPGEAPWQHIAREPGAVVARLELPTDDDGDPDYSPAEWRAVAEKLATDFPGCYFAYVEA